MTTRAFYIPIVIDDRVRANLKEVYLYVKDESGPWQKKDTGPPTVTGFTFFVPHDGEYEFSAVTVDKLGRMCPTDVSKEPPGMIVVVDTHRASDKKEKSPATRGKPVVAPVSTAGKSTPAHSAPRAKGQGMRHKDLVPALIKALSDPDKDVVQSAATALGHLGADAIPAVVVVLQSKEATLRARAALALEKMGSNGEAAIPALLKSLQDPEVEVRRQSAQALAAICQAPNSYPVVPRVFSPKPE